MKIAKALVVPGLILVGALVLTGCGDKDAPAASPSPSESGAMMEDDDMMSPSPSEDSMMEDDDMMSPSPSGDDMMSDG